MTLRIMKLRLVDNCFYAEILRGNKSVQFSKVIFIPKCFYKLKQLEFLFHHYCHCKFECYEVGKREIELVTTLILALPCLDD